MGLRVFVSSVIEGYEAIRTAVRHGIELGGGDVLMAEDLPAHSRSPRNACLDLVDSCDVYVLLIGARGGWIAPSGKTVTEEEYEQALRKGKRIVAFFQEGVERDADAARLAGRVADYVTGHYRRTFASPAQLGQLVQDALAEFLPEAVVLENNPRIVMDLLNKDPEDTDQAWLRTAFSPERNDEIIDPLALESPELRSAIYEIGHSSAVRMFSYEVAKSHEVGVDTITFTQQADRGGGSGHASAVVGLNTIGIIVLETTITGRGSRGSDSFFGYQSLDEAFIVDVLTTQFSFASAFYDKFDRHGRFDRFAYNAVLGGIKYREWHRGGKKVAEAYSPGWNQSDRVFAFDEPRMAGRNEISNAEEATQRIATMLRRRFESRK